MKIVIKTIRTSFDKGFIFTIIEYTYADCLISDRAHLYGEYS